MAAAYLWLKVDSDHHAYYNDLSKEQSLLPLYRLITWFDPHLVEPYFVASYMLYLYHRPREALALARDAQNKGLRIMVGCMLATSLAMAPAMLVAQYADVVDLDGPLLLKRDRDPGIRFVGSLMYPAPSALWG